MNIYYYSIKVYDEVERTTDKENGYVAGSNYSDAIERLMEYYGDEYAEAVTLKYVADRPILILPEEGAITQKGLVKAIFDNNNI